MAYDAAEGVVKVTPWNTQRQQLYFNVLVGVQLPCIYLVAVVGLFTYTSQSAPVLPWLVALVGGMFMVVSAWPTAPVGLAGRRFYDFVPLIVCSAAVALSLVLGQMNVTNMESWVHANYLSHYSNLLPDIDPRTVSDAGIVDFGHGTVLDFDSSAGFYEFPTTYCAAPIVAGNMAEDQPVGFWAVGINCCDARGRFTCNDASDRSARSGLRISSHPIAAVFGHDVNEYYMKAVKMAAASFNMRAAESPVLVAWLKDPMAQADWRFKAATAFYGAIIVVTFGVGLMLFVLIREQGRVRR